MKISRIKVLSVILLLNLCLAVSVHYYFKNKVDPVANHINERIQLAKFIGPHILKNEFVDDMNITWDDEPVAAHFNYTIVPSLQKKADGLLKQYKPDYAAIVLMDANTGAVLTMSSFTRNGPQENLNLKASFPAASTFKLVTATVAVDKYNLPPELEIPFNGGMYTLYKKNVFSEKVTKWTNIVSLKQAFAKSLNTAFARLSLSYLQPVDLAHYAERFQFNKQISSDFPVERGIATVPSDKNYELAEVSSGFTKDSRMSPVQGAMMAASVVNGGMMKMPYLVQSITTNGSSEPIYVAKDNLGAKTMSPASASILKKMMAATVTEGTSRKSFKPFFKKNKKLVEVEVGGKTGHLNGDNPKGRCDWFVGYAQVENYKLAIAVLTVNIEKWQVKSSHLAQTMIDGYIHSLE